MTLPALTAWDWAVGLIVFLSIAFGIWRGLIRTVFALLGWVAALLAIPLLGPVAVDSMGLVDYAWVAYVLVFVAVWIIVRLIGRVLARGARSAGLAGVDRLLGGAIGVARAVLIIGVIVVAAKVSGANESASWKLSFTRPLLEYILTTLEPYLPEKVGGVVRT